MCLLLLLYSYLLTKHYVQFLYFCRFVAKEKCAEVLMGRQGKCVEVFSMAARTTLKKVLWHLIKELRGQWERLIGIGIVFPAFIAKSIEYRIIADTMLLSAID